METTLTASLTESWLRRYQKAADVLRYAAQAPTLFRPEFVAELQQQVARSEAQYRYWLAQDVAR